MGSSQVHPQFQQGHAKPGVQGMSPLQPQPQSMYYRGQLVPDIGKIGSAITQPIHAGKPDGKGKPGGPGWPDGKGKPGKPKHPPTLATFVGHRRGDALVYMFGGYATSLTGMIVYHIYAVFLKHWPKTAKILFITSTAAVLLGIFVPMIVEGRNAGGFFLYWFVVFQMGFGVMRQADTIALRNKEQQAATS